MGLALGRFGFLIRVFFFVFFVNDLECWDLFRVSDVTLVRISVYGVCWVRVLFVRFLEVIRGNSRFLDVFGEK